MPHVVIKMIEGRGEAQKQRIAELVTQAIMEGAGCKESSVSIAIEDVPAADWTSAVYRPEIEPAIDRLYKKPGYGPE
ncbi:putative tautomerase XF_1725 [uncultured Pleomorphomonas sp.]|uniref:Putative tautomerase XF_1725 n=1 Tax=uncultured Pleomorphomonas sp. TaxID=442121 RepID=A0A212LPP4_9HYPH|nr:tautomerase family protein [uncultured Pleomorphomonas sp.]SCM79548.1 putative tautomerase XF_1725 [uncultured Pleomorphomonas sp.]